jgi:branched-chain amino acid transport system substrate-binding protein
VFTAARKWRWCKLNRFVALSSIAIIVCGLTATSAVASSRAPGSESQAKTLTIGAVVSASGSLFEPGSRVKDGYEFWARTVNRRGGIQVGNTRYRIKLVILDDKSDATTAAVTAQRLISQERVNFMFGPYSSGLTLAVGGIVQRNRVVMIAPGGNANSIYTQGYQYVFGVIPLASAIPGLWIKAMAAQRPKPTTLALLVKNDPFAQSQRSGIKVAAKSFGLRIVDDTVYSPDQQEFSSIVSRMRRLNPDLIAALGHTQDAALILRQMRDQDYYPKGVFYSGPAMLDFRTLLRDTANHSYGATFWEPSMKWKGSGTWSTAQAYARDFQKAYGRPPSYQNATASASGVILQLAMQKAKSINTDAVRRALLSSSFQTFEGPVRYAPAGYNRAARVGVQQIIGGSVYVVYPNAIAQRKPIYPGKPWG